MLVLVLLVGEPVGVRDADRRRRLGLEPGVEVGREGLLPTKAQGEPDVSELEAVRLEQLAQGAQPLQLGRPVEPVARCRSGRFDQTELLDVTQHPRRPTRGRRCLVDRLRHRHRA